MEPPTPPASKPKLSLSLDFRWMTLALLAIIVIMLLIWKPWSQAPSPNARTVTVTGDTTVKAVPDEYVFYASYQTTNANKVAAIQATTDKSNEIVAKLKTLGVVDKQIKTSVDGYQTSPPQVYDDTIKPVPQPGNGDYTYTLQLTVTLIDKAKTQTVQDYLTTTGPTGSVTPVATLSQTLTKQLQSKARDAATRDARAKADQSAKNLGFKVGSVKSVDDGSSAGGGIRPLMDGKSTLQATDNATSSLAVQPGENELSYSVTVTYYIK